MILFYVAVEIPQDVGRLVNMQRLVRVSIIRIHHRYVIRDP